MAFDIFDTFFVANCTTSLLFSCNNDVVSSVKPNFIWCFVCHNKRWSSAHLLIGAFQVIAHNSFREVKIIQFFQGLFRSNLSVDLLSIANGYVY